MKVKSGTGRPAQSARKTVGILTVIILLYILMAGVTAFVVDTTYILERKARGQLTTQDITKLKTFSLSSGIVSLLNSEKSPGQPANTSDTYEVYIEVRQFRLHLIMITVVSS